MAGTPPASRGGGVTTQNTTYTKKLGNMTQYNTMTSLGPIMSKIGLTGPTQVYSKTIHKSSIYNSHFYTKYIHSQSFTQIRDKKKKKTKSQSAFFNRAVSEGRQPPVPDLHLKYGFMTG